MASRGIRMTSRLSAVTVFSCLASTTVALPQAEEIRIGSLGQRGVTFTEELPRTFSEVVSAFPRSGSSSPSTSRAHDRVSSRLPGDA